MLFGIHHCHFCVSQFPVNCIIDGCCPNCGVEIGRSLDEEQKKGGEKMAGITAINDINDTDSFLTKCKKLTKVDRFEIVGCEIGHGYCVMEFNYMVDATRFEAHLKCYDTSVYAGWRMSVENKFVAIIDDGYDVTKPEKLLPPPIKHDMAGSIAPNEKEEV